MKKILFSVAVIFYLQQSIAQSVGIGTTTPSNSALLEVNSTSKGVLMPRLTTAQRKAISNPVAGLMVYDTDKNTLYLFDGISWNPMATTNTTGITPVERFPADMEGVEEFGNAVAISGNYAIIGCKEYESNGNPHTGTAYIFYRDNGNWVQQARLVASDAAAQDFFGNTVAISGDYAIVGASQKANGVNLLQGAAYIFVRNGTNWVQQAKLIAADGEAYDIFGISVSIFGNYAAVGSYNDDIGSFPVTHTDRGSAYIFIRNGSNWTQQVKVISSSGNSNDNFGESVSMYNDSLVVGAPGTVIDGKNEHGAAYLFVRNGSNWLQAAQLNHQGNAGDRFGTAVAIRNGLIVCGAPYANVNNLNNTGLVSSFRYQFNGWVRLDVYAPDHSADSYFGSGVSMSDDMLIIGAPNSQSLFPRDGKVYLFKKISTAWQIAQLIIDPNRNVNNNFGCAVFIDGFNIAIGVKGNNNAKGKVCFLNIE